MSQGYLSPDKLRWYPSDMVKMFMPVKRVVYVHATEMMNKLMRFTLKFFAN